MRPKSPDQYASDRARIRLALSCIRARSEPADLARAFPLPLQFGVGLILTAVAGFVDAVGFIALGGFFASFMSGASISLGLSATEQQWLALYHAAVLIAVFVAAATISIVIAGAAQPWAIPATMALEAACLSAAVLMTVGGYPTSDAIIPVVAAMGVQNTALQPINGIRLGVTFMTGTLVSFSQALGESLVGRERPWMWAPHALVWFLFVAGAAAGAAMHRKYGFSAIVAPMLIVCTLGALTFIAVHMAARAKRAKTDGVTK